MATPEIAMPGLRPTTLASYLAAVGLARVLADQTDPDVCSGWRGDVFYLRTEVEDVPSWLVHNYAPSPVLSPWNSGSGFGAKDKNQRKYVAQLMDAGGGRLERFTEAARVSRRVAQMAAERGWVADKSRIVQELRNRCPDEMLPWLDASVVLAESTLVFPPLLGTGGNDGRLDFSTNFHQRLHDVLPELGADGSQSRTWAASLLQGETDARLVSAAVGQFDSVGGGGRNSSPFGAADSLVNPWAFVLLLEGALQFASGLARRAGSTSSRASIPFTVSSSEFGHGTGAMNETSRGELWVPVWTTWSSAGAIQQLFREARATWQGRTAARTEQMYEAVRSLGVARGIDRFVRYGLHQRNGLAFSAVALDDVEVRLEPAVRLAVDPERTMRRLGRATSGGLAQSSRSFDRAHIAFARDARASDLRDMLVAITHADLSVMRSARARETLRYRPRRHSAGSTLDFLHSELPFRRELRVAAGFAAAAFYTGGVPSMRPLRELVLGTAPASTRGAWRGPEVSGLGIRPLAEVLAGAVVWRSRHRTHNGGVDRGFVPFPNCQVVVPWGDLRAWTANELNDDEVERSFLACLALDWRRSYELPWRRSVELTAMPLPALTMLHTIAAGRLRLGSVMDGTRVGMPRQWPARILAGQLPQVLVEAEGLLQRCGWQACAPGAGVDSTRLVAALALSSTHMPLTHIGARHIAETQKRADDSHLPEPSETEEPTDLSDSPI